MEEELRRVNERLRRVNRRQMCIIDRTVGELGISPSQHFVLMQLSRSGRVASQAKMAEMLHVSPARITLAMKGLEAEGYIERASGADTRRNEISLTPKGEEMVRESFVRFQRLNEQTFAGFDGEELSRLAGYLDRVLDNLDRMGEQMRRGEDR